MTLSVTVVTTLVLEGVAALGAVGNRPSLFFTFHLASCLIACPAAKRLWKELGEKNLAILGLVCWVCFPLACLLAVPVLLLRLRRQPEGPARAIKELFEVIDSDDEFTRSLSLEMMEAKEFATSEATQAKMTQEPLADVLRTGDLARKKKILSWLRFVREPWSVRLLKLSQKDSEYEMQYLASRALASMEQEWHDEIKLIAKRIDDQPARVELREQIVELYVLLHQTTLLTGEIGKILLRRALGHAEIGLELDPNNVSLLLHLGDIHTALGNYEDALAARSRAVECSPQSNECRIKKAESLYYLSRFRDVAEQCRELGVDQSKEGYENSTKYWVDDAA